MIQYAKVSKTSLYLGEDIQLTDHISIHQPTVGEVFKNDSAYLSVVYSLCATPSDLAYQLENNFHVDFVTADEYEVFVKYICPSFDNSKTKVIFGDELDFSKMQLVQDSNTNELILKQHIIKQKEIVLQDEKRKKFSKVVPTKLLTEEYDIVFDKFTYRRMTDYLRLLFNIEKNERKPKNKGARKLLIEESRQRMTGENIDGSEDQLLNMISYAVNMPGFKHDEKTVFDMKYYCFLDSVKRLNKITNSHILYQSGYSGFGIDLSKISDKNEINAMGDL